MKIDYHMHTTLTDGHNTHEEMVLAAIEKGFDEIGFTDHFCITKPGDLDIGADLITRMKENAVIMQKFYCNRINILFGIEVDYFDGSQEIIRESLQHFDFDYVIGSIHFLDDWNFDACQKRYSEFKNDFLYEWYFGELQKAAKSQIFDVMGHPDLIKLFGIWPETSKKALFEETANIFADSGVAFELNTSGKDRPCGEFFPGNELLEAFFKAGIPVTLGSDSHKKVHIGRHFDEAGIILGDIGYSSITRFRNRKRDSIAVSHK
jgi:histidinol-phosphatase (PHP family)